MNLVAFFLGIVIATFLVSFFVVVSLVTVLLKPNLYHDPSGINGNLWLLWRDHIIPQLFGKK
jgi:hypothetical protein